MCLVNCFHPHHPNSNSFNGVTSDNSTLYISYFMFSQSWTLGGNTFLSCQCHRFWQATSWGSWELVVEGGTVNWGRILFHRSSSVNFREGTAYKVIIGFPCELLSCWTMPPGNSLNSSYSKDITSHFHSQYYISTSGIYPISTQCTSSQSTLITTDLKQNFGLGTKLSCLLRYNYASWRGVNIPCNREEP